MSADLALTIFVLKLDLDKAFDRVVICLPEDCSRGGSPMGGARVATIASAGLKANHYRLRDSSRPPIKWTQTGVAGLTGLVCWARGRQTARSVDRAGRDVVTLPTSGLDKRKPAGYG